jgi:hypothetical protein
VKADFIVLAQKTVILCVQMIKAFLLILNPGRAWEKIAQEKRGFVYITLFQLLPLILVGTLLEAWGLHQHGKWQPKYQFIKKFLPQDIINYAIVQFVLLFVVVFVSALLVYKIAQTFQDRLTFLQAFTTVAYAFSPMLLVRFLDYGGAVHPAVTWGVGILMTIWILYSGIPRVMKTDPTHAFGVYISAIIVVIMTSGLARLLTAMYLLGYMDFPHSWLWRKISHLLGH